VAGAQRPGCRGGSGRLTLLQALLAVASRSMQVAYVDLPGSLDPGYLADLGADLEACLVLRPPRSNLGVGLAMARTLVRAGLPWVAVALGGDRAPTAAWEHSLTALVEAVWGGRAVACVAAPAPLPAPLAYASSLTLGCSPLGWHEAHGDVVGLRVRLEVAKSRVGAPGAEASLLLRFPRPHAVGEVVGLPTLLPGFGGREESGFGGREKPRFGGEEESAFGGGEPAPIPALVPAAIPALVPVSAPVPAVATGLAG
jgi:hypothetical protein